MKPRSKNVMNKAASIFIAMRCMGRILAAALITMGQAAVAEPG